MIARGSRVRFQREVITTDVDLGGRDVVADLGEPLTIKAGVEGFHNYGRYEGEIRVSLDHTGLTVWVPEDSVRVIS